MSLWKIAALAIGVPVLGWLILAYESGAFIPDDSRYAVAPGDFTPDAMASQKRLIDLGGYKIAYLDIGHGEPVICCMAVLSAFMSGMRSRRYSLGIFALSRPISSVLVTRRSDLTTTTA